MATREVKVGLRADVTPYISGIRAAERATTKWADRAVADANRVQATLGGAVAGGAAGPRPTGGAGGPIPAAGLGAAAAAASAGAAASASAAAGWNQTAEAMTDVGQAAGVMGAAIQGGLLLAGKAAIDWESAWTGVTKTVDGSTKQMAQLEAELRGMATTLPIAHKEIAGVAEAAGQLGVKRADIAGFTKTMVDLGVSTNLAAEDAATSIAQMMNVMGTAADDVDRVGATLVALGNAGASTERDIMEMTQRLTGAGALVGATEASVLALANAMSSVGIEAELGGGAMSRTLNKMYVAVKTGGKDLESFARTARMSATEFATAFQTDPMGAVAEFVAGLGRIKDSGGNVIQALGEVKIKGTQDLQVLLRLAGASDVLADSLDLGATAWEQNTALTDEASKRYATVASKLKVARNALYDLAIQVGDVMLPFIAKMADGVSGLSDLLSKMPGPVRQVTVALVAIAGATALFGGALLLTIPRIVATRTALQTLAASAMWANIRLHFQIVSALVGGPWVLAFAAAAAAVGALLLMNRKGKPPIDDLTDAIKANGRALNEANRETMARRLQEQGVLDLAAKHKMALQDVTAAAMGSSEAQDRLNAAIAAAREPYEARITQLQKIQREAAGTGKATQAAFDIKEAALPLQSLDQLSAAVNANADAWKRAGAEVDQEKAAAQEAADAASRVQQVLDNQLNEALGRAAARSREAAGGSAKLSRNVQFVGAEAEKADKELKDLTDTLAKLFDLAYGADSAADAMHKSFNDLTEAAKNNGLNLTANTNAAIANREEIRRASRAVGDWAEEMLKAGEAPEDVAAKVEHMRQKLLDKAAAVGYDRAEVRKLISVLEDLPAEIRSRIDVEVVAARLAIEALRADLAAIPGVKNVLIDVQTRNTMAEASSTGRSLAGGRTAMAGGGLVRGAGGPRDDAIPAWLSNGEFVVNAAATSRHRGTLEHINAGRYAAGGIAGGWHSPMRFLMPRTLEGVEDALEKLSDRLDKVNSTLKEDKLGEVRKERREFAASVKAAFLEAANITQLPGAGTTGAQMVHDLHGQLDRAVAFNDAMGRLRKAGLNETALDQLLAAGAEGGGLDAARQMLSAGNVKQVNALMAKIAEQGARLGTREATADFAKAERRAAAERRELLAERRRLVAMQAQLTRRQKALEKAEDQDKAEKAGARKARVSTRTTSTGTTLSAVRAGDLAAVPVKVTFDLRGTDKHLKAWIQQVVRTDGGGSVQKAFGS